MNLKHQPLILLLFMCLTLCFTGCKTQQQQPPEQPQQQPAQQQPDDSSVAVAVKAAADSVDAAKAAADAAKAAADVATAAAKAAADSATAAARAAANSNTSGGGAPDPSSTPAEARFIPVTLDIVNGMRDSEVNFKQLHYYLSNPFAITVAERNDPQRRLVVNDDGTLIVNRNQTVNTRKIEFKNSDEGAFHNMGASSEFIVINFKVEEEENDIPLRFIRNSQGRYDLSSAEIETEVGASTYNFHFVNGLPQLCIFAQLNEHPDVLAVFDSTPGGSQRNTGNVQPPARDRGQSPQNVNSSPAGRNIMGSGSVTPAGITAYVIQQNPSVPRAALSSLINTYISEAGDEGINHDIAIAQMLYATDFLRNRMTTYNYGGLSTNGLRWDGRFDDMTTGVQAHIQHLKGYASTRRPNNVVDPRYDLLGNIRGRIQTFEERLFFETWSPGNYVSYRNSINRILNELYRFSASNR